MAGLSHEYVATVRRNLRPLFANWTPSAPIRLGDYGALDGDLFLKHGNVRDDFKLTFEPSRGASGGNFHFISGKKSNISIKAAAKTVTLPYGKVQTQVTVQFESENDVFFSALGCSYQLIRSKKELGETIHELHRQRRWESNWVVITDLVRADSATILVAKGAGASVTLDSNAATLVLEDALSGGVEIAATEREHLGFELISNGGLTPLFGLCRLSRPFLRLDRSFRPLGVAPSDELGEDSEGELQFAQLD